MWKRISRSTFLKGMAGIGALALGGKVIYDFRQNRQPFPCRKIGPSIRLGHMLRDAQLDKKALAPSKRSKVVIVGGGISGLSAAWWLKKNGFSDFLLLELEKEAGGNSVSGKNSISAFPWGAHYIPIANSESTYVRMLFEELGIIESYAPAQKPAGVLSNAETPSLPVYNELYLCHDPQERLFKDGSFQEGLVPHKGLQPEDHADIARFFQIIARYKKQRGSDGKPAFAIPIDLSSRDPDLIELDRLSFMQWLKKNNFSSRQLFWYLNYCCRDDYGSTLDSVSAWAGLHYFAGRTGQAANTEGYAVVTWPEGNGFIVEKLAEKNREHICTGAAVLRIEADRNKVTTRYLQTEKNAQVLVESDYLIFAAPRFMSRYLIKNCSKHDYAPHSELVYAPWMVANISLKKLPRARGEAIAWDNVSYYGDSLGYVVATHQNITTRQGQSVITYYYPLTAGNPVVERAKLQAGSEDTWRRLIVSELEKIHPDIAADILAIDLWPWGHGMIRPSVGFIWGEARRKMKESNGLVFFAHSDMSGISIFEEAQYQGVEAAKQVLAAVQQRPG